MLKSSLKTSTVALKLGLQLKLAGPPREQRGPGEKILRAKRAQNCITNCGPLAILLLKKKKKQAEYITVLHLSFFFVFKKFPIGFKENLRGD